MQSVHRLKKYVIQRSKVRHRVIQLQNPLREVPNLQLVLLVLLALHLHVLILGVLLHLQIEVLVEPLHQEGQYVPLLYDAHYHLALLVGDQYSGDVLFQDSPI